MRQKRFREARAVLEVCARDVCPRVARTDCLEWLAEATDAEPSILIVPHEAHGHDDVRDVHGVRATIDEVTVIEGADAGPLPIDQGRHRIRLERPGADAIEQTVDVHEGDKNRVVDFYWRVSPAPVDAARPIPAGVFVTATVAALAMVVGTSFEVAGLAKRQTLNTTCLEPKDCTTSEVDSARDLTRVGDVTLGAGALFLVGAAVLYLTRPGGEPPGDRAETAWSLGPVPGGFVAGFGGRL